MARGLTFSAGLTALIALALVHETLSANDQYYCPPSSCGNIPNISFPFRLKSDPESCGDPRYELSCENNRTVLHLFAGNYHVQKINYNNYTIRVADVEVGRVWLELPSPIHYSKPNTSSIRKPNSTRIIIPSTSRPTYIYIY